MTVEPPDPTVLSSAETYNGHFFNVRLDVMRMPNGHESKRETILHPGAVCAVAVDAEGLIHFVTQYRHAARGRLLELPAGTIEPEEDPATAIVRELQEEIGFRPGIIEARGGFFVAPGYTDEYIHLYFCRQLTPSMWAGDDDEDIVVHRLNLEDALGAIDDGRIRDAKTVIGILRWAASQRL